MKVVLSRKSMDSKYGGLPSPVMTMADGSQLFFPLPIPYQHSVLRYQDLSLIDGFSVWDFIQQVAPSYSNLETCHLDPDLRQNYVQNRPSNWQPAFGQMAQSQTHLERNGIGPGDVFLFFGWFQFAEFKNETFCYTKSSAFPFGFHALYGYLQIDKMYKPNSEETPLWMQQHAHIKHKGVGAFANNNNSVYTATKSFIHTNSISTKAGAGEFVFHPDLILSKKNQPYRTLWELPEGFHPEHQVSLTYNPAHKWRFENGKTLVKSAAQGQEFIFTADPNGAVETWCTKLIERYSLATVLKSANKGRS